MSVCFVRRVNNPKSRTNAFITTAFIRSTPLSLLDLHVSVVQSLSYTLPSVLQSSRCAVSAYGGVSLKYPRVLALLTCPPKFITFIAQINNIKHKTKHTHCSFLFDAITCNRGTFGTIPLIDNPAIPFSATLKTFSFQGGSNSPRPHSLFAYLFFESDR